MAYESPQIRRLRSDHAAMERLLEESSVIRFKVQGKPAQRYLIEFRGRSLARDMGKVAARDHHEVEIKLGSAYPRTMPEIRWLSPIYHPNISEIGLVCLGGYGTHWVPSLHLDDLCVMLWDMARFHNYDIRSPYNKEAALWAANQSTYAFPTDARPLRDKRAALGRIETITSADVVDGGDESPPCAPETAQKPREEPSTFTLLDLEVELRPRQPPPRRMDDEVIFID
jgi:ubiquitin-protein ligase